MKDIYSQITFLPDLTKSNVLMFRAKLPLNNSVNKINYNNNLITELIIT